MDFDLKGYLETEPLAISRSLLPLFEAVVNALDALEDCGRADRRISIHVERDLSQMDLAEGGIRGNKPIIGFRVEDNGVGFTNANFESFNTSFSRYKKARGGKGVGRFCWLQAFDETIVTSTYKEGSKWYRRHFIFSTTHGGVGHPSIADIEPARYSTTVHLKGFKKQYAEQCPTKADTLAGKILEHCLFTFLSSSSPSISLSDDDDSTIISLNDLYATRIIADLTPKLRGIASRRGFTKAPDDLGYFWFNPNNNAYIELLSFEKLVQDAEQRNMALFKKLGLHLA